ncbi:hypothetical protein B7P43_G08599 [Cryptotermes secundus]|uniref:Uncharacterized protein n=1 Tax=Cryptotermes secundus TaxID=105785 RepID=A0A2J7QZ07_9NEOP|nr:hypothetical protein B7P43_G08599 [Cryptotermes secundus]
MCENYGRSKDAGVPVPWHLGVKTCVSMQETCNDSRSLHYIDVNGRMLSPDA